MDRIALTDVDVFRLECEGCNANEIAVAMQIPVACSVVLMQRARLLYGRAQDDRLPGPLGLQKRAA
jgi:DNA-directed RNA polymerase specialized sigma24 family protein